MEIRSCVHKLKEEREFIESLADLPLEEQKAYEDFERKIMAEHALIKHVRNRIGGHVEHSAMQEALNNIDYERHGLFEIWRVHT